MVKFLIANCAKINTWDGSGLTLLLDAVIEENMEIISVFMENGADLKIKTKYLRNNSVELALKRNSINILKKLLQHQLLI